MYEVQYWTRLATFLKTCRLGMRSTPLEHSYGLDALSTEVRWACFVGEPSTIPAPSQKCLMIREPWAQPAKTLLHVRQALAGRVICSRTLA